MGKFIDQWIRDGDLAGYWDGRFGHWNDRGLNGNNGVMATGCIWEGFALRFPANTDEVTIADDVTLRLIAGAITAALDVRSMTATEYVVAHDNAGSGYSLGINAGGLVFTGDGVARTLAVSLHGVKSIGVTFTHGGTPIGYVDGLSVGNFSGAVNITAAAVATEIGNWANSGRCKSPIGAVLLGNRIFTGTEMADAHVELVGMSYPTKLVSAAKRRQVVNRNDPKLISGWNLKPAGGIVPDEITTRDLTTIHQMMSKPGILGPGMSGPILGGIGTANDPYASADFDPNGCSVEVWCRFDTVDVATRYLMSIGDLVRLYYSNTGALFLYVTDGVGAQIASSAAGFVRAGELIHLVGTAEANGAVRLYIDSVLQPNVDTMTNFNIPAWARPMTWGARYDFTAGMDGPIYKPRIYNYALTQAEVSAKYLEGAKAVHFKTDWGFRQSPVAEGGTLNQIIGGPGSPFRAGDAVGRFKIETDTVDGRLCKVLTCTVAGVVYVKTSDFFDTTSVEAAFGTWDWWHYKPDAVAMSVRITSNVIPLGVGGYRIYHAVDESVELHRTAAAVVIAGGTASADTWHHYRVTRSSAGDFYAFIDEVSFGTANNLVYTSAQYMALDMEVGTKIALADVRGDRALTKYLGVNPP